MKKEAPIKVVRIFALIRHLSDYPPKSVDKLALMMDVSPKTKYKDIQLLEALGFETKKDDNNRYLLKNNHRSEYPRWRRFVTGALVNYIKTSQLHDSDNNLLYFPNLFHFFPQNLPPDKKNILYLWMVSSLENV